MISAKASSAFINNVARQGIVSKQFAPVPSIKSSALATYLSSRHTTITKVSYGTARTSATISQGRQNGNDNRLSSNSTQQTPLLQLQPQPWPNSQILKNLGGVRFNSSAAQATAEPKTSAEDKSYPVGRRQASDPKTLEFNNVILNKKRSNDLRGVVKTFETMKEEGITPSRHTYNLVLDAHATLRKEGVPLNNLLRVFEEMVQAGYNPDTFTYSILIRVFCRRDAEVQKTISMLEARSARSGSSLESMTGLETENNLHQAMALFEDAVRNQRVRDFDVEVFNNLLRSLAYHGNTQGGLFVFEQLEHAPKAQANTGTFAALISLYGRVGDLTSSLECFKEFQNVRAKLNEPDTSFVYNALIDAYAKCDDLDGAINVIERIMPEDGIPPNPHAYNIIIRKFCLKDDVDAAMGILTKMKDNPALPNPDASTFGPILNLLCQRDDFDRATVIYNSLLTTDISRAYGNVASYTILCLAHNRNSVFNIIKDMRQHGLAPDVVLSEQIITEFADRGEMDKAVEAIKTVLSAIAHRSAQHIRDNTPVLDLAVSLAKRCTAVEDIRNGLQVAHALTVHGVRPLPEMSAALLTTYEMVKAKEDWWDGVGTKMTSGDYTTLISAALAADSTPVVFRDTAIELLRDMKRLNLKPHGHLYIKVATRLAKYGDVEGETTWKNEFAPFLSKLSLQEKASQEQESQLSQPTNTALDMMADTTADTAATVAASEPGVRQFTQESEVASQEMLRAALSGDFEHAARVFDEIMANNLIPSPEVMRDVIAYIGKQGNTDLAEQLMNQSLKAYQDLPNPKLEQRARYQAYNSLLTAYAQNGDIATAKIYYEKIKQMNLKPDANAYASLLIGTSQETTDEFHDAMTIYEEARAHNIRPTTFFYNVLISRLAKARKLEIALRLFEEMKSDPKIHPNSITYSAVISACLRAGNVEVATQVFDEMTVAPSYQPRIAPFNSMMQFYARQTPDRAKVLSYFAYIRAARISPSTHTYRLLMEAHACIEPYDMKTAHSLLAEMRQRDGVKPVASHYATLVYSYGCLQRDVASAQAVLNDMKRVGVPADETVYQAMLDVHITNGQIVEAERVYKEMERDGIRSTPYIENQLIRGYGESGNIAKAEKVFEAMVGEKDAAGDAVFREPSTYEAMVKAYIANGEMEKAKAVVRKMEGRDFPEKVVRAVEDLITKDGNSGSRELAAEATA